MIRTIFRASIPAILALSLMLPVIAGQAPALAGDKIDICSMVSDVDLAKLHRKKLYPTPNNRGCFWSKRPNGMAYMDINLHKYRKPLRKYFNPNLPGNVKLVEIKDLGDEGLMSINEGALGVVVIKKGDRVLRSTVLFLDIEPGGEKQAVLWEIYRRILGGM